MANHKLYFWRFPHSSLLLCFISLHISWFEFSSFCVCRLNGFSYWDINLITRKTNPWEGGGLMTSKEVMQKMQHVKARGYISTHAQTSLTLTLRWGKYVLLHDWHDIPSTLLFAYLDSLEHLKASIDPKVDDRVNRCGHSIKGVCYHQEVVRSHCEKLPVVRPWSRKCLVNPKRLCQLVPFVNHTVYCVIVIT